MSTNIHVGIQLHVHTRVHVHIHIQLHVDLVSYGTFVNSISYIILNMLCKYIHILCNCCLNNSTPSYTKLRLGTQLFHYLHFTRNVVNITLYDYA